MQYVKRSVLSMKSHPELNEKWLQAQIVEHPEMLGFGEVTVHNVENVSSRRRPARPPPQ